MTTETLKTLKTLKTLETPMRTALVPFVVLALLLAAIPATAQPAGAPLGEVNAIAHRGASAYAPEHTFFAYDLAVEMDTDFQECDLQLTADEVLVCVHDSTVDRTSDGTGDVSDMTLAELRVLDWGSWFNETDPAEADPRFVGAGVVPLEEQIDCYRALSPAMRFHIETKDPDGLEGRMEAELLRVLQERGMVPEDGPNPQTDQVIVQSFSLNSLEVMKELEPRLTTAFLFAAPGVATSYTPADAAVGAVPDAADILAPNFAYLLADQTFINRVHANGSEVHTYTVDDPMVMDTLLGLGIDAIFSNVPDVLRERVDDAGNARPAEVRDNPTTVDPLCPGIAGTVEGDATAEALRLAGLTFAASGPPSVAASGSFAYAPDVLLSRDDVFADALASGTAQGLLRAPLLLTDGAELDGRVRAELVRLGAQRVHLLGGEDAIGADIAAELRTLGYVVERIGGADRIETAVAVARTAAPEATTAILARDDGPGTAAFADSLAAGALGATSGAPILLTDSEDLSAQTASHLARSSITSVVIAGGESAVSAAVAEDLEALDIDVARVGGLTRFETAVAIAGVSTAVADGADLPEIADRGVAAAAPVARIVLVDGTAPDGWAAGLAAASGAIDAVSRGSATVVLSTDGAAVPAPVADYLADNPDAALTCALAVVAEICPDRPGMVSSSAPAALPAR